MASYDVDGILAAASALEAAAGDIVAAMPGSLATIPPAADLTSVAATTVIDVHSAKAHNAISSALAETLGAATRLRTAAAKFTTTEQDNTALLGGTSSAASASAVINDLADAVSALPTLTIPAVPTVPTFVPAVDPEPMAAVFALAPGPTSLLAHSAAWNRLGSTLLQSSRSTASAATGVRSSWDSPQGNKVATAITRLSRWYAQAGTHAASLAGTSSAQANHYTAAKTTHPDQPTIIAAKQRITALSTSAATDPAVLPALAVEHGKFQQLVTRGNLATTHYAASSDTTAPKSDPQTPPKVTNSKTTPKKKRGPNKNDKLTATAGDDPTSPGAKATKSIAEEATARANAIFDQKQNDKMASTLLQIGTQVASQSAQAAQSLMSSVTSGLRSSALNNNRNNVPLSTLTNPNSPLNIPSNPGGPGSPGGSPGSLGTPLGDVPVGTTPGGDELGTTPSSLHGTITPTTAEPSTFAPIVGSTPTQSTTTVATGSMMHPPYGGMGSHAGNRGTARDRNHAIFPDRPVYVDDTPHIDDRIGANTSIAEMPPPITPLFTDDDDDEFVR